MGFFNNVYLKIKKMFGRGQKALPEAEKDKIIGEKSKIEEPKVAESEKELTFKEQIAQEAKVFNPELMPRNEAIMEILKQQGMKEQIAKNEDAVKKVLEIVQSKIGKDTRITSQNLETIEYQLSGMVVDGMIQDEKTEPYDYRATEYSEHGTTVTTRTIDVNDDNRTIITETEQGKYKLSSYSDRKNEEHTYLQKRVKELENGISMKETYDRKTTTFDMTNRTYSGNDEGYIMTRNSDLVTARVSVRNGRQGEQGGTILAGGGGIYSRISDGEGFEMDIKEIEKAKQEGRTARGFLNQGFSQDEELLRQDEEAKKSLFKAMVEKSDKFKELAIKRGLIEGPEIESKEPGEE